MDTSMMARLKELARRAIEQFGISIRVACAVFSISQSGYYYQAKLDGENARVADWLLR